MADKIGNWRIWESEAIGKPYGDMFFKRATGALPEMESSKAAARRLARVMQPGDHLLDVGCGAGHYYRSLKAGVATDFRYTGLDATAYYIERAKEAFAAERNTSFLTGDIFNIEFANENFDVALCSNVLTHLPSIAKPMAELCRVTRRHVLIRTLVADKSYIVMDVAPGEEGADFDDNGSPHEFGYLNIYGEPYLRYLLAQNPRVRSVAVEPDREFVPENLRDTATVLPGAWGLTKTVEGMQHNGPILLPWCWISIALDTV